MPIENPIPLDYSTQRPPSDAGVTLGRIVCVVAGGAVVLPLLGLREMLAVPDGAEIQPMTQVFSLAIGSATGLFLLPLALIAIVQAWRARAPRRWPRLAAYAAMAAVVGPWACFYAILATKRLTLAP